MLGLEKKAEAAPGGGSSRLALYGFNNLTKTLSFNIYDVCYAKSEREQRDYIAYIDEQYNSERLTKILCDVTERIGATVLNISKQDYDPQGASVNILFAEGHIDPDHVDSSCNKGAGFFGRNPVQPDTVHAHLDKSHITVHTFPEYHFMDHNITSIQDYIDPKTLTRYDAIDVNVYQSNLFHTKMLIKEIELQNYLFNSDVYEIHPQQRLEITNSLRREMIEIFSGMNIY